MLRQLVLRELGLARKEQAYASVERKRASESINDRIMHLHAAQMHEHAAAIHLQMAKRASAALR